VCFTTKDVSLNGETLPGLGFNIVRYNLGACSSNTVDGARMVWPPRPSKWSAFHKIDGFWLDGKSTDPASGSWDWTRDVKQRAMLAKAKERGARYFELFSNSPMWWMCRNFNPSGVIGGGDNLNPQHYRDFAIYLATVARYAHDHWGIDFTTVEPFNEPSSIWWRGDGRQEGCHISSKIQAQIIPLLRDELDRQGLASTPIAASDESLFSQGLATWNSFSPETREKIEQFNVHCYQEKATTQRSKLRDAVMGKRFWASEYGDGDSSGLLLARGMGLDFQLLRPAAWSYWQLCDNPGWALVPVVDGVLQKANPKYYVLAQYTRHILPGMSILTSPDANTVAAFDSKSGKLVLVTTNSGPARQAIYDLSSFNPAKGSVTRWLTEPKAQARYERSDVSSDLTDNQLKVELPASSVQTFEIEGISQRF
jgi:galactan endo-1,6-beta-galactosidase